MENNKELQASKKLALHYMEALAEVSRESFLILDPQLRVLSANPLFYQTFQVSPEQTEHIFIYDLGNKQWDIPELRRLLEEILPKKKVVKNYEVTHTFETVGEKTIMLNAKQLDAEQLIILAMEDVTDRRNLEEKLAAYTGELEVKIDERTKDLDDRVAELETLNKTMIGRELRMVELKEEIKKLEKLVKNGVNGNKNKSPNSPGSQISL